MYSQHELSAKFPRMPVEHFEALVEDIKANGLRHPIILYEGKVLDGWHRERACVVAKINPQYVKYTGKNPAALVVSENIHRRDLTASQRALAVVECNEWMTEGRQKLTPSREGVAGRSTEVLASESNTSHATVERAKIVAANGSEALKDAVRSGETTVTKAAEIAATVPKKQQAKALKEKPEPKPKAAKPEKKQKPVKPETVPKAKYDELAAQYNELRENRDDLAAELEAVESVRGDAHVVKIKELQFELRACRRSRDEQMVKVTELTKGVNYWKKKFEKTK